MRNVRAAYTIPGRDKYGILMQLPETQVSSMRGRIDYGQKTIYIDKKLDKNEQVGTLLHEATHYLDDKAGIEMTEKQIEIIAEVRHKIIVVNKLYK